MATYIEDSRYFNERSKAKVHCKCGCSSSIPSYVKKTTCRWCGRTIWKNPKDEFLNKLNIEIRKNNKEVEYDNNNI